MAEYIKKSDLEKHIIREGCDEGCGYIDERDLKDIPTYEVYGTEEVMVLLTYLQEEIAKLINSLKEQEDVTKEEKSWECRVKELEERIQQITLL